MGTFDAGPFGNDAAADFLAEAAEAPARTVGAALRAAADAPADAYLDVDDGQAAHAAAEIVAMAFGRVDASASNADATELASRVKPSEALRVLALRAVDRVEGPRSELAELWREGAGAPSFTATLGALRARLVDAASGPRKAPRPKVGEVIELSHAGETLVLQVLAPREVVVFRGARGAKDDPLVIAATREGTRTVCEIAAVARDGRVVGRAPVRAAFKGKKTYATEVATIERYATVNASFKDWRWVDYEEARAHDLYLQRRVAGLARLAHGEAPARPRSPDEREAAHRRAHKEEWERRRALTTAGPFGDPEWTAKLFDFVREYGAATIVHHLERVVSGATGSGDAENTLRWQYAQVGLLALWLGRFPIDEVPESLRAEVPPAPAIDLASCGAGARAILDQVAGRESELRMIWADAPDGGAAFRASIAALRAAFPD